MEWLQFGYARVENKISSEENTLRMSLVDRISELSKETPAADIFQLRSSIEESRESGKLSLHSYQSCAHNFHLTLGQLHLDSRYSSESDRYLDQSRELVSLLFQHYELNDFIPDDDQFHDDIDYYLSKVGTAYSSRVLFKNTPARRLV